MEKIEAWIILAVLLGIYSYWDIKTQRLPMVWLLLGGGLSVGMAGINIVQNGNLWLSVTALFPGAVLLILAFLTRQKIGYGDGCLMMIVGNIIGLSQCMLILAGSIFLCFCFSCLLLMVFKKNREYRIPFAPFCLAGTISAFVFSFI